MSKQYQDGAPFVTNKTWVSELIENKPNRVNHPDYYNNGPYIVLDRDYKKGDIIKIECIDIIRDMPSWKGNAIKYEWRCGLKKETGLTDKEKEIEDINKAIWYLQDKINQLQNEPINP